MRARAGLVIGMLGMLAGVLGEVLAAAAQAPPPGAAPAPLALVGGRRIERVEYERRLAAAQKQAATVGGDRPAEFKDLLRRQMLETMIRLNLLVLEARREGIVASGAEAESTLQHDPFFNPDGKFDVRRWQLTKATEPGRFQTALALTAEQLAARKLNEQLEGRFRPTDDSLRARAMRQLRHAIT